MNRHQLTVDARRRLVVLLIAELSAAWDTALATGATPARLAQILRERRRDLRRR